MVLLSQASPNASGASTHLDELLQANLAAIPSASDGGSLWIPAAVSSFI